MANLFNSNYHYSSSPSLQDHPDEISLFLHQILLHSSSSSPPPSTMHQPQMIPGHSQVHISSGLNPASDGNASSSSNGNLENELDNYDCESEEAIEALVEETAAKPTPSSRSCSKRSRAAEVHNLSEKRRRSRINEKMKALQNLIPNSNKTDKASMLDEAIEYLKQLQLQVQMLTMRNGLSLYPISLPTPGLLQPNQTRMEVDDSDKFINVNMTKPVCMDQNISAPVTDFSRMVGSKTSFDVESSIQQHHFGAFQLSKGICEKVLPCRPLIEDHPHSSSGTKAASSIPCETQTTNLKGNVCESGGDRLLANFVNSTYISSPLNM